jgi:arsenate reductase (glutaredoxin)
MSAAFPVVIYHNPECGTSRNVVEIVRAAALEPSIVLYLETGWTRGQLLALFAAANLTPRQALRETKSPAAELGLLAPDATNEAMLEAMLVHPVLVNRPIVATPKGIKLCRPSEAVLDMLDRLPRGPLFKEDGQLIIHGEGRRVSGGSRAADNAKGNNVRARSATTDDAGAIADIYNQGIEDRIATFETAARTANDVAQWFASGLPIIVVEDDTGLIIGWAAAFPYADRSCYAGIAEFSVYVRRDQRGKRVGEVAVRTLLEQAQAKGLWKLLSRVFPENEASLSLLDRVGFKRIGVHEKHGKLDGVWRDCVIVEKLIP